MPWPQGRLHNSARSIDPFFNRLTPVLMTFRGQSLRLSPVMLEQFELTGQKVVVDGRPCIELKSGSTATKRMYVDPSQEYVIVRYLDSYLDGNKNKISHKTDVQFKQDKVHGWIPEGWKSTWFWDEDVDLSIEATIKHHELNAAVSAAEFDIEFPPGTVVVNMLTNERHVIKATGEKRPVLREEQGLSYEQVINSEPGEILGERKAHWTFSLPAIITFCICFGTGAFFAWRRFFTRRSE